MPNQEIDEKPYSESTRTKLDLFERYAREWLPVFLGSRIRYPEINICDFFSGSGADSAGSWGSPLLILKVVREYQQLINAKPVKVRVYLSDKSAAKISRLTERIKAEGLNSIPAEIE